MTERITVPCGDYDRFWEPNGTPEIRTPRWQSSGAASLGLGLGTRDDRPAILAATTDAPPAALADEGTGVYATADNAAFEASTRGGGPEGFRLSILGSATAPYPEVPTASGIEDGSLVYVYTESITRAVGSGRRLSSTIYLGNYEPGVPGDYFFTGGTYTTNADWKRNLRYEGAFFHTNFPGNFWDTLRDYIVGGQVHVDLGLVDLTTYDIAYLAMVVDFEPAVGSPPRRVFPRDDSLAGGAPRTFPPSRSAQNSARIPGPGTIV